MERRCLHFVSKKPLNARRSLGEVSIRLNRRKAPASDERRLLVTAKRHNPIRFKATRLPSAEWTNSIWS